MLPLSTTKLCTRPAPTVEALKNGTTTVIVSRTRYQPGDVVFLYPTLSFSLKDFKHRDFAAGVRESVQATAKNDVQHLDTLIRVESVWQVTDQEFIVDFADEHEIWARETVAGWFQTGGGANFSGERPITIACVRAYRTEPVPVRRLGTVMGLVKNHEAMAINNAVPAIPDVGFQGVMERIEKQLAPNSNQPARLQNGVGESKFTGAAVVQESEPRNIEAVYPARLDLEAVCQEFSAALQQSHINFGPRHNELVRSFVVSLATKRFAILTGMSGSGKTQIAMRFGEWLGKRCSLVVPVRPDWTGAEALFGFEDALHPPRPDGRRVWHVPEALAFIHKAADDPHHPYLLILDEMNLAHVERYFADVLSGMESGQDCLRCLIEEGDGWLTASSSPEDKIPLPDNLFIVGTVNIDETTYMFSPKVLDRANTFEFRVRTDDLSTEALKPIRCNPGDSELVRGFLNIARDEEYHSRLAPAYGEEFVAHFRALHALLADGDFEFGHRVFYEAIRFAALLAAAGNESLEHALDLQVMQKVLPRLHGNRRRLEPTLCALGQFCYELNYKPGDDDARRFDPLSRELKESPKLELSFEKVRRMTRSLQANQFTSFTE